MIETKEVKTDNGSGDPLAKARAAKRKRKSRKRIAGGPVSELRWYLLGCREDEDEMTVISHYPNSNRLVKGYEAMKPMLSRAYSHVAVVRGKEYNINDLA